MFTPRLKPTYEFKNPLNLIYANMPAYDKKKRGGGGGERATIQPLLKPKAAVNLNQRQLLISPLCNYLKKKAAIILQSESPS